MRQGPNSLKVATRLTQKFLLEVREGGREREERTEEVSGQ